MTIVRGVVGGLLGAAAMDAFSAAVSLARGGPEAQGAAPGLTRYGRGVQPAQADGTAAQDAAVKAGSAVFETVAGHEPAPQAKPLVGVAAHYGLGATAGLLYAVLARRMPALRAGYGTFYGTLVWAIADEGIVPALGLSRKARDLSPGIHAFALGGHFAYGATLECVTAAGEPGAVRRG